MRNSTGLLTMTPNSDHVSDQDAVAGLRLVTARVEIRPAKEPGVRRQLPGVPGLDHLEVLGPLWGQGIGTALIRAAEDTARQLGHERIALGVGLGNPKARRLYERLGDVDWGHGTVEGTWVEHPDDGPPVTLSEVCDMLIKRL
jgi:GNAT superfamily N-acetyltransferase